MSAQTITWEEFRREVASMAARLPDGPIYGVPTGGSIVALELTAQTGRLLLDAPIPGCIVVDDLVDTGYTLSRYKEKNFAVDVLYRKPHSPTELAPGATLKTGWIAFPWEHGAYAADAVTRLLELSEAIELTQWMGWIHSRDHSPLRKVINIATQAVRTAVQTVADGVANQRR